MEVEDVSDSTPLYVKIPRELAQSDNAVADLISGSMAEPLEDGWRIFNSAKVRQALRGKI